MEPAEMKKYLVPGLAVAAVIAVAGLMFGLGGPPPETPDKGSALGGAETGRRAALGTRRRLTSGCSISK